MEKFAGRGLATRESLQPVPALITAIACFKSTMLGTRTERIDRE
jgi:hypothetical protein